MRTRNAVERLAVAGRPLLADVESCVDVDEENRILERILASSRTASIPVVRRKAQVVLALACALVVATAVAAGLLESGGESHPLSKGVGHGKQALTGAEIQLAGHRFRTPAGFKTSTTACDAMPSGPGLWTVIHGVAAAASAEGGCVEGGVATLVSTAGPTAVLAHIPRSAEPVAVGDYQAYFLAHAPSDGCAADPGNSRPCPPPVDKTDLYVYIPDAGGPRHSVTSSCLRRV
jgi:hypothetical protein